MIAGEIADGKWSEKIMDKEDVLRTVMCLRGRLLAERAVSRKAKEDAELMGNKLIELETKLREEIRSRNKAEKKLKNLMKKLKSMNISYHSDESENSSLLHISEITSVTTTPAISTKSFEDKEQKFQSTGEFQESIGSRKCSSEYLEEHSQELIPQQCEKKKSIEKRTSQEISINLEQAAQMTIFSQDEDSHLGGEQQLGKSSEHEFSNSGANRSKSLFQDGGGNGEDGRHQQEDNVDNSMALVPVDLPMPKETIDPVVLDATVREVLDALRHAKEKLQAQLERGRTIKVG